MNPAVFRTLMTTLVLTTAVGLAPAQDIPEGSPVADALRRAEARIQAIVAVPDDKRSFDNTLGALDDMLAHLELDTNMLRFLQYVSTDAAERERSQKAEEDTTNWLIAIGKREDLYKAVKAYAGQQPKLDGEQKRLLEFTLRDFRRAGMELSPEQRNKLKALQMEINKLGIEFEKNIRDDDTRVPCTKAELDGMSDDWLANQPRVGELYLVGMDYPSFYPLMDFCRNETTRQKVWVAYKRRGGAKNVKLLEKILELRAQCAKMLGYASAADYEIEVRMAKNAATVKKFYEQLRPIARKKAQLDYDEYVAAKRAETGDPQAKLYPWDTAYYKNQLMKTKYAVDAQKVQEYFPLQQVMDGLFGVTQSLYGIEYRDATAKAGSPDRPIWHPDAKYYEVYDKAEGRLLGAFYLDLHPRENKYSHAAQWGLSQHKVWADGKVNLPLAALVCNFTKPTPDKPALLTHDEVETFFHEFGHCLHTILSETRYYSFAGTNVARDFVEAPSQMFENWVWDGKVLKTFAKHYKSGEPFPDELLKGMLAARNLGSGLDAEHQFYYGLTDLTYHSAPEGKVDTTKVQADLFAEVELFDAVPNTYYQAAFGHLIGYQAGYYGYQYSLVYACDMFRRFRELGMLNPEAGQYYRKKILARGGSIDEMEIIKDYLGREPQLDAYLEHLGLTK